MYQVNSTYSDQQKQQQMVFATSSTPSPPPTVMPFLGCVGNACNSGNDGNNILQSIPSMMPSSVSSGPSSSATSSFFNFGNLFRSDNGGSSSGGGNRGNGIVTDSATNTNSVVDDVAMDCTDTSATDNTTITASSIASYNNTQHDEADQVGARELQLLTPKQRERLFEEIHGVIDIQDENPEFITKVLEQLDDELSKIRDKSEYSRALFLSPRYVKDNKFRLMFLRATSFHPKNAAKRMVTHFKHKAELFGLEKVAKTITLEDLQEDEYNVKALRAGGTIFLSQTDSAGRPITLALRNRNNLKSYRHEFRAQWYSGKKKTNCCSSQKSILRLRLFCNL